MKELATALAKAQSAVTGAEKDAYNQHHKYDYASAEQMIHICSAWLNAEGLSLVPLAAEMVHGVPVGNGGCILRRKYLLLHASGESLELVQDWPAEPGKGRPLDKAVAGADTSSLSYLLRDLLLVPRVEEGTDLNHDRVEAPPAREKRDDRPAPREERPPREEIKEDRPPREEPAGNEGDPADELETPREQLWNLLGDRVEGIPDCAEITNENLELAAKHLFKVPIDDLSDEEVAGHLRKLKNTPDAKLYQLIGAFFVPF